MKAERPTSDGRMPAWHAPSLRGRIALLAGTVVILLTATLLIFIWVLRTTQAHAVARSQKHLAAVSKLLAKSYEDRLDRTVSIAADEPPPLRPPPPHPPPQLGLPALPKPHPPLPRPRSPQEQTLAEITAKVLEDESGIEGGFFRVSDEHLIGYAFPTHEGPGDRTVLPARETPDIAHLASTAFLSGSPEQNEFHGPHDVVLFAAVPVCETKACTGGPVGAAWMMQRIPGAEADRKRAFLWGALGFGTIASITVLFAFFVLSQVGRGTDAVLGRLTWMESNLDEPPRPANVGLAEFHHLLDGLDRLSLALRDQRDREQELQGRVRQNERLAAIGQLAAGVAHELRNPLATIRLRAQMAQRKAQDELTAQGSGVILAEVDRLDAMIERLLDFSRPIRLNPSSVDLASLCSAVVERWKARYAEINMKYVGDEQRFAIIDPSRVEQLLDNLIENAVHQHEDRQTHEAWIHIDCSETGGAMFLAISDNAGGFTAAALTNATEPFFTTRARGTGLGLAITKEIVQAFGASLTIRNEADGASVRIELPNQVH